MKKIISVCLVLLLLASLCICVHAEEKTSFADAVELMEYWGEVGYPDDVGSIYSTDGTPNHLTVQLIGDTDGSRAAEIAAMLDDPGTITFEAGLFSDKDLHAISENIRTELMPNDDAIKSCSVGWGKKGGFGVSGQELRVVVNVEEARVEEYAASLAQRYGEAVVVEAAKERAEPMEEAADITDDAPAYTDGISDAAADTEKVSDAAPADAIPGLGASEKITDEAPADAVPVLGETGSDGISEKTESTIITTVLLVIAVLLAVILIVNFTRKKNP